MSRFASLLVSFRYPLLAVGVLLTLALFPYSRQARFDRSIHSFFDKNDPRFLTYNDAQREFGGDTLCLAVYPDADLLTPEGMVRLEAFAAELGKVAGVVKTQTLSSMPRPGGRPGTIGKLFSLPGQDHAKLREEILATDLFRDQFISRDGQTAVCVLLIDEPTIANGGFTHSLAELRRICESRGGHIVGAPVMINDVYDYLEQDSWVLTNVSTWAMILVIVALFRRLRWLVVPIAVVQTSLIWMQAMMYFLQVQLSLTGAMTTAMITVIGITSAIHVAVRFREVALVEADVVDALRQTLTHSLPPIFWACATTAIGFGALAVSQVAPVRSFGLVMGVASLMVFVAIILLMPGAILLGRNLFRVVPRPTLGETHLADGLHWAVSFVGRHAFLTTAGTFAVLAVAGAGLFRLAVETDFTKNFKESSTILQGYRFVEGRLGGAGLVDIVIDGPEEWTGDFFDQLRSCEAELRAVPGVVKVTSIVDMLDLVKASSLMISVMRRAPPPEVRQFWNPRSHRLRVVLRVKEQQTTEGKAELLSSIDRIARDSFGAKTQVTGLYLLLVYLIDSLLSDQYAALLLSCLGNLAMMTIAFRGPRAGLIAFLPNVIPLVITLGAMGWLGLKINVATAMIQSISMGIAVDFSIHYLYRYWHERKQGIDFYESLSLTHRHAGKAMVFADIALTLGFGILTLSHFLPTIQFGLLVSLAMLGGLVGNLVMLPVLLRVFYRIGPPQLDANAVLHQPLDIRAGKAPRDSKNGADPQANPGPLLPRRAALDE
jgi:predicted RND superfamily exporter protein